MRGYFMLILYKIIGYIVKWTIQKDLARSVKIRRGKTPADFLFRISDIRTFEFLLQVGAVAEVLDAGAELGVAGEAGVVLQNRFGGVAGFFHQEHVGQ